MISVTSTDLYGRKHRYVTEIEPLHGFNRFNPGRLPLIVYDWHESLKDLVWTLGDSTLFGVCRRSLQPKNNDSRYAYYFSPKCLS